MGNSRSGSGKPFYIVPENMRTSLAAPVGILATTKEEILKEIAQSEIVVTVGDIVTLGLLESGIEPDISIVDYMTKREFGDELKDRFSRFPQTEITVKNPPGQITAELWNAIEEAFRNLRHLRIIVEGEEDLAALACIALAPDNTTVIYGIPNRGASIHHVDDELKRLVKDTLNRMKA